MTKDEIKAIQSTGIDWTGAPLKVDGTLGPKTNWWMGITSLSQKRQELIRLVLGYHASSIVFEKTGKNDSEFVDNLFRPVGMHGRGYPWCVALVSHCVRSVGVEMPYLVSAYALIEWGSGKSKIYNNPHGSLYVDQPLPGDLEVYTYPKKPGDTQISGHGRIVTAFNSQTKQTVGVDGNVSNDIRVGERHDRPNRKFVRVPGMGDQHGPLFYPTGLVDLDQLGDR